MKRKNRKKLLPAIMIILFVVSMSAGGLDAASKAKQAAPSAINTAGVKSWNCSGCHKGTKVLPEAHVNVKEMPYEGCLACHLPGEGMAGTLKTKVPGSHLHALRGINCDQCHGKTPKREPVEMDKCVACHGETAKLAAKTVNAKPHNPHQSPHYGTEADCNLCHHQHAKSENFCAQCHKFEFIVP